MYTTNLPRAGGSAMPAVPPALPEARDWRASAQVSTGVEISLEPKVSFKIASGIEVTVFSVPAAVALKGPVLQHQPVVQGAAQPS